MSGEADEMGGIDVGVGGEVMRRSLISGFFSNGFFSSTSSFSTPFLPKNFLNLPFHTFFLHPTSNSLPR